MVDDDKLQTIASFNNNVKSTIKEKDVEKTSSLRKKNWHVN